MIITVRWQVDLKAFGEKYPNAYKRTAACEN